MTANLLLACDMAPEPPRCHNRQPLGPGYWRHGISDQTGEPVRVFISNDWTTDRCATWDGVGIGPPTADYLSGTPYPVAHGWAEWCKSCRWYPAKESK